MAKGICSVEDCERPPIARGWCGKHYQQFKAQGVFTPAPIRPTVNIGACSIERCGKRAVKRGWCSMHYKRWRLTGTTDLLTPTPEERFWRIVDQTGDGCWEWTGAVSTYGYGQWRHPDPTMRITKGAHRWAWYFTKGPIADGLFVCHHCDNPLCVRPSHLFLGTQLDNMLDCTMKGRSSNGRKTHCAQGHEYTPENIYPRYGNRRGRNCKACALESQRRRRARKKAANKSEGAH